MPLRPSGSSFMLRLFALVVIPLLGLALLTIDRIDDQHARADAARALVDRARVQQAVAAVYGPAQLEQIALEGLATIDALGIPREVVVTVAGVDFESTYGANAFELDRALDRLLADHGDLRVVDADGTDDSLGDALIVLRGRLAGQRLLSTEMQAEQEGIREVFSRLDELLVAAVDDVTGASTTVSGAGDEAAALVALGDLHLHAGNRGIVFLNGLLNRSDESSAAIVAAEARFAMAVESFERLLDPRQAAELAGLLDELVPVPDALVDSSPEVSFAVQVDPAYIEESAGAFLDQLAFLASLEEYSNAFHTDVVGALEARADDARSAALDSTILFGAIALLSLAFVIAVALSTLRPLRRLTVRAAAISAGSFDAPPLPTTGPSDVRTLTGSMNEMMATLRTVDHQLCGLADGEQPAATTPIPGDIGESLRRSFRRLADTTARLHASEQLASAIVEQAVDAIWTVDAHGLIRSANDASVRLLGIAAADQFGLPLHQFLPTSDGEATVGSACGRTAHLLVRSNPIESGDEPLSMVIAHDISERQQYEERLEYQAHHDALTALPNRFAVLERLGTLAPGRPVAVLFVDLDGFKSVNDTQGHVAGDRVLTEVADRLSSKVRPGDFVGRLGGDEFVIVMQDYTCDADVVAFGNRLIRDVEQPHGDGDNLFMLSASIGVATYPNGLGAEHLTPLEAIRQADNAVYAAKRRGRGRVELFDAALQASIVRAAEIEIALRHAVRNDELELHLQPVLDTTTGVFCGAEALVRWNRGELGTVPPNDFIPVAERSSLIFEIDRWVLGKSCEILARWREEDPATQRTIAVNIAGSHLIDGNLLDDLDAALLSSGADPTLLEFELTETQLMDDFERATAVLHEVRARGIRVAVDDFGTGYSSMAYLRELPIDTLKIDRSFVASVVKDSFDSTVIDALLTIGHALGLSVVAEGIEHDEQLEYLTARGCDRVQGFLLARPMPVDDAEHVLFARSSITVGG